MPSIISQAALRRELAGLTAGEKRRVTRGLVAAGKPRRRRTRRGPAVAGPQLVVGDNGVLYVVQ